MQVLGRISGQSLVDAHELARSLELSREVHSAYAATRLEKWYRFGSNLQSIPAGRGRIFQCQEPHNRLVALGERIYPGWHSLLVCGGVLPESSTSITPHRDHGHFVADAVMLNLGEAVYREQPERGNNRTVEHKLTDGLIVRINTKLIHSAQQTSTERYNFTYRKIKAEYLN